MITSNFSLETGLQLLDMKFQHSYLLQKTWQEIVWQHMCKEPRLNLSCMKCHILVSMSLILESKHSNKEISMLLSKPNCVARSVCTTCAALHWTVCTHYEYETKQTIYVHTGFLNLLKKMNSTCGRFFLQYFLNLIYCQNWFWDFEQVILFQLLW